MKRALIVGTLMLASACLAKTANAGMIIQQNFVCADAYDGAAFASDDFHGTAFDTHHLLEATVGDYFSRVQADYTQSTGGETISHGLSQRRGGSEYGYAEAYQSTMQFVVTENTTYRISGFFSVTDVQSAGAVFLSSYLYEQETNEYLFLNTQTSQVTQDESFVLGQQGGDQTNSLAGSLEGNLVAGRTYYWYWQAYTWAFPQADAGASVLGNFTLTTGSGGFVNVVPEPTSIALWSLGLVGMTMARRRRRS